MQTISISPCGGSAQTSESCGGRASGAPLLPTLGAGANVITLFGGGGGEGGGPANGVSQHETDDSARLEASYELDFGGRTATCWIRRRTRSAPAGRPLHGGLTAPRLRQHLFSASVRCARHRCGAANLKSSEDILNVVQRRVSAGFSPSRSVGAALPTWRRSRAWWAGAGTTGTGAQCAAILLCRPPSVSCAGDGFGAWSLRGAGCRPALLLGGPMSWRRKPISPRPCRPGCGARGLLSHQQPYRKGGILPIPPWLRAIDTLPGCDLAPGRGAALAQSIFMAQTQAE